MSAALKASYKALDAAYNRYVAAHGPDKLKLKQAHAVALDSHNDLKVKLKMQRKGYVK